MLVFPFLGNLPGKPSFSWVNLRTAITVTSIILVDDEMMKSQREKHMQSPNKKHSPLSRERSMCKQYRLVELSTTCVAFLICKLCMKRASVFDGLLSPVWPLVGISWRPGLVTQGCHGDEQGHKMLQEQEHIAWLSWIQASNSSHDWVAKWLSWIRASNLSLDRVAKMAKLNSSLEFELFEA